MIKFIKAIGTYTNYLFYRKRYLKNALPKKQLLMLSINLLGIVLSLTLLSCTKKSTQLPLVEEDFTTNIRLIFTGDIMVHQKQLEIAKKLGNYDNIYNFYPQFAHITNLLQGDLVIGNLETVLKGSAPYTGYPSFNSPDSLLTALKNVGFNMLFLANNHILDYGVEAGLRTKSYLQSQNIITAGIATSKENYVLPIVQIGEYKIGFINGTYGSNRPIVSMNKTVYLPINSEINIAQDVQNLRKRGADFIVAVFHWGNEYTNAPNKAQKELADKCFSDGVDLIVGHHPHILQPMEIIEKNGKTQFIAWSLGNFISSQRTIPRERTVILAIDLIANKKEGVQINKASVAPLWVNMIYGVKAELLPTQYGELSLKNNIAYQNNITILEQIKNSPYIQKKLIKIHQEITEFLKLPSNHENGFYTVWQK